MINNNKLKIGYGVEIRPYTNIDGKDFDLFGGGNEAIIYSINICEDGETYTLLILFKNREPIKFCSYTRDFFNVICTNAQRGRKIIKEYEKTQYKTDW
jgi:hypothetical protein